MKIFSQNLSWFLGFCLLNLSILFLKRPDAFLIPQFYAEDGSLFFADAYNRGIHSLFEPYAGYLHLFPRLWAFLFFKLHVSLVHAPLFFNAGWLAAFFWFQMYLWIRLPFHNVVKGILSASVLLLPLSAVVLMNLTLSPLIWALTLAAALFSPAPKNRIEAVLDGITLFMAGLTGPYLVLLFPVYLLRRPWRSFGFLPVLAALVAAFHVWILCTHFSDRQIVDMTAMAVTWKKVIYAVYLQRAFLLFNPWAVTGIIPIKMFIAGLLAAGELALTIFCLKQFQENSFRLFCLLASAAVLAITLWTFRHYIGVTYPYVATRYSFVPAAFWVWAVLASKTPRKTYFCFAVILLAYFCGEFYWGVEPFRLKDAGWKEYALKIEQHPGERHMIPIHPEGWKVVLNG